MFPDVVRLCSSSTRLKILKFFAFNTEERAPAVTVASTIGGSKVVVSREASALARLGILNTRKSGKVTTYAFNKSHPLADSLKKFLGEATLPDDRTIARAFTGVPALTLVVATGILANEPQSSVDLLIVARRPHDPRIAQAIRKAEHISAMPLRYAVLETKAFRERLEARDRLLRDILEFSHRIIIGRK